MDTIVKDESLYSIVSSRWKTLVVILLVALLLRVLVLSATSSFVPRLNDQNIFEVVTEYFIEGKDLYALHIDEDPLTVQRIRAYPYGPMPTLLFSALFMFSEWLKISFALLLRFFHIVIDLLFTFFIYVAASRLQKNATLLGWIYALNPVTILIVSFHGQLDVLVVFLAFLAWYLFQFSKKELGSGLLLGLSIAMKLFTVILWPLFLQKMKKISLRTLFTALVAAPFWLSLLMVLTKENVARVLHQTVGYSGAGARNGFTLIFHLLSEISGWQTFSMLEQIYRDNGKFLMLGVLFLLWVLVTKKLSLIDNITLFFLVTYVFIPTVGVQYFVWFLPFYLLSGFFKIRPAIIQLGLVGGVMGFFYFVNGVQAGAFEWLGLSAAIAPSLFFMYSLSIGLVWIGFVALAVVALRKTMSVDHPRE